MSYNQQYPYNYQQSTPGPPQPQWQAPPRRTGWYDPRLQAHQQQASNTSSPISPASVGAYQQPHTQPLPPPPPNPPLQYGYPPGVPAQPNTAAWGVKYNTQQYHDDAPENRPHLPPRPPSSVSQNNGRPDFNQTTQGWQQAPRPSQAFQQPPQSQWQIQHEPPPKPPRPPEYQAQIQAAYQQSELPPAQYSHQSMSPHYDPRHPQQLPPKTSSPVTGHIAFQHHQYAGFSNASVPTRPHVAPAPAPTLAIEPRLPPWNNERPDDPDYIPSMMQAPSTPGENQFYASALGDAGAPSDWEHFGAEHAASPDPPSPPSAHAMPGTADPERLPLSTSSSTPSQIQTIQPTSQASDVPSFVADGVKRTGTIDSVIQAWNAPVGGSFGAQTPLSPPSQPVGQSQIPPLTRSQQPVQERIVEVEKIIDPYDDLEPEFKASLKRYVAMLRKEVLAEADEDKFKIFQSFITRELNLRRMLYSIEPPLSPVRRVVSQAMDPHAVLSVAGRQADTVTAVDKDKKPSQEAPSAPAGPSSTQPEIPLALEEAIKPERAVEPEEIPGPTQPIPLEPAEAKPENPDESLQAESTLPRAPSTPASPHTGTKGPSTPDSWENFQGEDHAEDDDPEYSPGGRPVIKKAKRTVTHLIDTAQSSAADGTRHRAASSSPGTNAPIVLTDYAMLGHSSPGADAPMTIEPNFAPDVSRTSNQDTTGKPMPSPSIRFEPDRPVYTPFRYNTAIQPPSLPADQSYTSLRKGGEDSDRFLKHASAFSVELSSTPAIPSTGNQNEAFIGLIRQQSVAARKTASLPPTPLQLRPGTPAVPNLIAIVDSSEERLQEATSALRSLLPDGLPSDEALPQHPQAYHLKTQIDGTPDDFSFINATVVDWDRTNREVRHRHDTERSARQAESEQEVDDMFNDNEIGYADISGLEADFKQAEAKRKYEEDQQELESFTKGVYEPVTQRLQREVSEIDSQYAVAIELLENRGEAVSQCLKMGQDKVMTAFVMNLVMTLFSKLELRYQKMAEADVERERRRKRLELTVLFINGDTKGTKALELGFNKAETLEVLHQARVKDDRANKLMDVIDRATVRGLGDNQSYVDDLLTDIKKLRDIIMHDASNLPADLYEPGGARATLSLAQKTVDLTWADSRKLLMTSNVADKFLNDADYSVSVAEARASDADPATYKKLSEEKSKEDAKIIEDTNSRMNSISQAPEEAITFIREVVDRIGDDTEHQDRIHKALEAAKRRNTGVALTDGPMPDD